MSYALAAQAVARRLSAKQRRGIANLLGDHQREYLLDDVTHLSDPAQACGPGSASRRSRFR